MRAPDGVDLELIVVDDSPEGSAAEVAGEFADSVRHLRDPEPTGGFSERGATVALTQVETGEAVQGDVNHAGRESSCWSGPEPPGQR